MRRLAVLLVLAGTASAAPRSNPPFLGISMTDAAPGCRVDSITPQSPAAESGLEMGDIIVGIDGVDTPACTVLSAQIVAHQIGDKIPIDVLRMNGRATVRATLSTRAAIVHKRLVGQPIESVEVTDLDSMRTYDLDDLRGHTTIVGLFSVQKCGSCASLFRRVADASASRKIKLIALTSGSPRMLDAYRQGLNYGTPVYVAAEDFFMRTGMQQEDRAYFLVVDSHGITRFVAPMTPDAEDLDVAIGELLAATDQAEHARATGR